VARHEKSRPLPDIKGLKIIQTTAEAGGVVFYGVIDFRALSFPDLSMGETAARPLFLGGWECLRGQRSPVNKSEAKTSPFGFTELLKGSMKSTGLKSQMKENATPPGQYYCETVNNFHVSHLNPCTLESLNPS